MMLPVPGGITGSAIRHQQVSLTKLPPKRSILATAPPAFAPRRPHARTSRSEQRPGAFARPSQSAASASHSVSEKCGLPSATSPTSGVSALLSSAQVSASASAVTTTCRSRLFASMAAASVGASGVTPATWNIGAAEVVAKAAPKAFRSSCEVPELSRPQMTGISFVAILPR